MAALPKFANTNALWATVATKTLARLGIKHVVISPGSRSTPLAFAFANDSHFEITVALDERSAGFIALGQSKARQFPSVLLCTSGTAGANYLPAVIEARLSQTPLLVLTADRPPELRHCHSGQTIEQNGLFGSYPVWAVEAGVPSQDLGALRHWRQLWVDALHRSLGPQIGPVHLNLPFRDPLTPSTPEKGFKTPLGLKWETFFDALTAPHFKPGIPVNQVISLLPSTAQGVIIVGPHHFEDRTYSRDAIADLSTQTSWAILADGAGTLRGDLADHPNLVTTYDFILRQKSLVKKLTPEVVVQIGPLPTSKVLRAWLTEAEPQGLQLGRPGENLDPTHGKWRRIDADLVPSLGTTASQQTSSTLATWQKLQSKALKFLNKKSQTNWAFEGRAVVELTQSLSATDVLVVGNSMPIRDLEWLYHPTTPGPIIITNRGANGIDGTVSTALGVAHTGRPTYLLCGDLTFLHDSNALLSAHGKKLPLTILVINNQGGGIFNHLPVTAERPLFEKLWGTPQVTDLRQLCAAHRVPHTLIKNWRDLTRCLQKKSAQVRVLELRTDRQRDAAYRLKSFNQALT
jgi:2-succinyl-5-enolpyruvyl-6-hydroxy-3-cyclohexene-1-carboxylate synthase